MPRIVDTCKIRLINTCRIIVNTLLKMHLSLFPSFFPHCFLGVLICVSLVLGCTGGFRSVLLIAAPTLFHGEVHFQPEICFLWILFSVRDHCKPWRSTVAGVVMVNKACRRDLLVFVQFFFLSRMSVGGIYTSLCHSPLPFLCANDSHSFTLLPLSS